MNNKFKKNDLVFINDLKIYGTIDKFWDVNNDGIEKVNYIIKDQLGIFHERFEDEITKVNDIQESIHTAKCNFPLETLIDLFNQIDKRYKLTIEVSRKKENDHSNILVPFVYVRYGLTILDKDNKLSEVACFIRNGELFNPNNPDYIAKEGEYECCLWGYDYNVKDLLFELYMEIITRTHQKNN